ncbi:MAG: hypothetical protein ACOC1F_07310 [Myxococcota bacterium]
MTVASVPPPSVGEGRFPTTVSAAESSRDSPSESFQGVFKNLAKEVDRGERVVRTALRGNPYADDARGMIALQAGVYRYVEAVELCTRLVDRAAGAVRTTLQSQ